MSKRTYLSNTSIKYGPATLAGRGGARALVLGRNLDLAAFTDIRNYFSVIIAEDGSYAAGLPVPADVIFWQSGSPYISSVFQFPTEQDVLFVVNYPTLKSLSSLQYTSNTYNLGYIGGGTRGPTASVVRGVPVGLDDLAVGPHLAQIMGAAQIWDTEGRQGTTVATAESISALIGQKTRAGTPAAALGRRNSLLENL